MITLTFDRDTVNERSTLLTAFHERPYNNSFTGSFTKIIKSEADLPEIPELGLPHFETVEACSSDGIALPISGEYNTIVDFAINYDDESKRCTLTISLAWQEVTSNV